MERGNSFDSSNFKQYSGSDVQWGSLQVYSGDASESRPCKLKTDYITLGRKSVRKREKCNLSVNREQDKGHKCVIRNNSLETLEMEVACMLTVVTSYLTSLACAFVQNSCWILCNSLRTIRDWPSVCLSRRCPGSPCRCRAPKSKLCNKSHSVILSLMILSFFPVIAEGFCPSGCNCDDATLTVNCENASLQVVPILLNPRVQTILLTRNKIQQLSHSLVFYTDLKKLDISHNKIEELGRNNFQPLVQLAELRLSHNRLTTLEGSALKGLVGVKVLLFDNNLISTIEDRAFAGLDSLIELDLSKNKLKSLSENSFSALPSLWTLNLSGNRLGSVPSGGLNNLTSLLELDLSDNQISQVPGQAFSGVTKLSRLILNKNNISHIDSGAFSGLCELHRLSLVDNRLFHVPSIALSSLNDLRQLDMSGNLFETLPQDCFPELNSLSSLTVSRCPRMSSVSSEAFLSTGKLETLVLSHNPLLASLSPAAFASLLNLKHVDLTACGLLYLTPTQIPVQQLESLQVSGNPLHCNCSLLWLARLASEANSSSMSIDQPTCASPPTLYGVSLRELGEGGVGCNGQFGLWTIVICVAIPVAGIAIIVIFFLCRWRRKKKKEMKKRNGQDKTLGMWSDVWRPENHLTHLPHPPPNGDTGHYQLPSPPHIRSPPRLPPDHPLHHLHHHHHQGCLQQCPYATLHPVYHPLLHPDHNSTNTSLDTPPSTLYGNYDQTHMNTHSPKLNSRGTPIPISDSPNWYETIRTGEDGSVIENGRESRSMTPLDLYSNSPRKVPVTYV